MRSYQLVLVLKTSLTPAERKKFFENLKAWLTGLKITGENEWGQKPLSYPIKKEAAGFYLEMMLMGENIPSDFEKKLLTNDGVLRHLLLRKE